MMNLSKRKIEKIYELVYYGRCRFCPLESVGKEKIRLLTHMTAAGISKYNISTTEIVRHLRSVGIENIQIAHSYECCAESGNML